MGGGVVGGFAERRAGLTLWSHGGAPTPLSHREGFVDGTREEQRTPGLQA